MNSSKLIYTYILGDGMGEYPNDLEITIKFDGETKFSEAIEAYKMFLRAVGYSEVLIERLNYEDRTEGFK